jgi:hypothetical protein
MKWMSHAHRKIMTSKAFVVGAICAAACNGAAHAYRPFDGTDADVASTGEVEIELGYLHLLREGPQKSLVAPAAVVNFGLADGRELVVEGRVSTPLNHFADSHRTTLEDAGISVKQIHRRGSLQEETGPSVASECGLLLPTVAGERSGAGCGGIVSMRGQASTVHLNGALSKNRDGHWERFLAGIVEGTGMVRPVGEILVNRDSAGKHVASALAGVIWTARKGLTFDLALRRARTEEHNVTEVRLGLTWDIHAARAP